MKNCKDLSNKTELSAEKLELLTYLLEEEGIELSLTQKITPRENPDELPLSFAQQRLWFVDQLQPGTPIYNIPGVVRLDGQLNVTALEQSLKEIVRRHEALRTNFQTVDEQPVQVIAATLTLTLPIVDLQELPETERQAETVRLTAEEAQQPFALIQSPLLRAKLLRLSEEEHVLLLTMHHIVSDGWSLSVFIRELAVLYEAFSLNRPSPLPQLSIQYADFAVWQRQWLQGEVLEAQLAYWKQRLDGNLPLLDLPTDRLRPKVQTFRGARQSLVLSQSLSEALKDLSQQQGVTLFMTLLTAFQILLYRYTGQQDILVGSPIANRNQTQTEDLIGFFVNMVVLRTDLGGNPSFRELLERVREVVLGAFTNQDLPFEKLVETLRPERDTSHTPLFQVMFALQNTPIPALEFSGLKLSPLEVDNGTAKFDLTLDLSETPSGIVGWFEYNTDLFDAGTIRRMVGHLQTLLGGIVINPKQRLSDLPLLTEVEQHQLLMEWNDTQVQYRRDECIHELFEAQVERSPDAVAAVFDKEQLSYQELNQQANQLAHHLRSLGVGPEVGVGICVERSVELVVGLLGILKAGGAYIPLDPSYPQERLAFMLEDAQPLVLLTQQRLVEELPRHEAHLVCLDADWQVISGKSKENPVSGVTANNLSYVLYTSGSTGKPKGVAIEHHSTVTLLNWARETFAPEQLVGVLASTSICFDLSVFELFVPLSCGGKVMLAENALDLLTLPAANDITLINTVPSAIAELLRVDGVPASVNTVNLAGEPLQNSLVQQLYQQDTIQKVFNLYGPSEDTTYSTFALVKKGGSESPAIGRPVANTQVYVLDCHLKPVPIGVPGELYIGGEGLARGYLNRPELTAEKFISNPFSQEPQARLYKTEDLVRYRPDGNIEFLGRIDHQVKIRGFRIELGEIEAVLSKNLKVREAVVIVREDQPGNKRLLAYIVPTQEQPTISELRRFLKEKLPDYMVPSTFVFLETMPLTLNGKVDRRALPAPERSSLNRETSFVPPYTHTEKLLTEIWANILGVEVGIYDNFFELGGHSLLATQVISRVREAFSVDLPLRHLFEFPTVSELSEFIEAARRDHQSQLMPNLQPFSRDGELPLSFAQQRLWFLDQLEGGSATYNMPAAVRLIGSIHLGALEQSLTEIVRRHEVVRTTFPIRHGSAVQIIASPSTVNLTLMDLQTLPEVEQSIEVRRLATEEAQRSFDLANGPLLRVTLIRLRDEEHVLLLTMHHIVSDEWSMGIFIRELASLYEAFSKGAPCPLPELPIQYADFAHWQRQWLSGEVLETQLNYWKQQLTGVPPVLSLPTDRPRPPLQTFQGRTKSFQINRSLTEQLKILSQLSGTTLFMTLLAAFVTLLYRYSNQEDIVVGSPIANRNRSEIESLIGFFVNTLVLRTDLKGDPSFSELLQRVRKVALGAYAHQDLPFEQLVEALQPQRNLSHHPLFQVMFALQNTSMPALELPGLTLSQLEVENGTAKFDLTLSLEDSAQGLVGSLEYNCDLFDAATITRMAGHFQTLLEGIVANPQQRVSQLLLLTAAERHQLLVEWNDTKTDYPQDKCIHELFEAQVEQTPDAIAVVFENQQLTYRELNARANQLAHHLQALGVEPEILVGICVERSLEMIVGLLGILKAGGAYVPLDPAYPQERLAYMLEDAQVRLLLTQKHLMAGLPEHGAVVVCLDADWRGISPQSGENLLSGVQPENLAYAIYTSGSTGKPKGVLVPHQGLCNLVRANIQTYEMQPERRVLHFVSLNFDPATSILFYALCSGARLYLSQMDASSLRSLTQTLRHQAIAHLHVPPSVLASLNWEELPALRTIIVGGEACAPELVKQWSQGRRFFNAYGPTEATVCATVAECSNSSTPLSIGRPIANKQIYILDHHLQPVPVGVAGEVHIGGVGLARGYLNCPDLSAAKFIPNPFSDTPEARLYKTGDLARYRPNGNIEFLGRLDHQVKIRGFRIELREIELVLAQHPTVRGTVVLAREDAPGDKRLVAYVVLHQEPTPTTSELRRFLKQQLPDYMVPSAFVLLDALPLLPNGKVDRHALPAPDTSRISLEKVLSAPRDTLELKLAQIWEELLDIRPIDVTDNFFDLGGHSLLAVRLMAHIQKQFEQELPLSTLFQEPTIEHLAKILHQQTVSLPWSPLVGIQTDGSKPPFFCVHPVGGNVLCYLDLVRCLGKEQPFYGLQAPGLDGQQESFTCIEDMAAYYIEALRVVQPRGPYFLGGWSLGGVIAFEMAQQLEKQGHQLAQLTLIDSWAPIPGAELLDVDSATLLDWFARDLGGRFGKNLAVSVEDLQLLDSDEQLNYVLDQARKVNVMPQDAGLPQIRRLLEVGITNLNAARSYVPQVYLNQITLFLASDHLETLTEEPTKGWNELAAGGIEIHTLPGNHYSILREPHVQVLAEQLRACLDRAQTVNYEEE